MENVELASIQRLVEEKRLKKASGLLFISVLGRFLG
jgi:hypothetical protein